jgi:predicted AAA+ superfamily ATPase
MNNFKLNEGTIITRNQQDKIKIDNKIINIIPIEKWIK